MFWAGCFGGSLPCFVSFIFLHTQKNVSNIPVWTYVLNSLYPFGIFSKSVKSAAVYCVAICAYTRVVICVEQRKEEMQTKN